MAKRMLINALYPDECRVAVAEDDNLIELEIERAGNAQLKGNIYKAAITRVEPSLQAAFLDIGSNRNGFLQINDINRAYYFPRNEDQNDKRRPSIQEVLQAGQELVVQVVKDERAAKGATLTTNLSIPGRYLVLMIGNQRGGVSRKIQDEGQRKRLRQAISSLKVPAGMGVIVRTAGINKSPIELQRDLDALVDHWLKIINQTKTPGGPILLYQEASLAIRTIRDYLTSDIDEILIDNKEIYDHACQFAAKMVPGIESKIQFYDKPQPLFASYYIERQIEETVAQEVILPSGGSIVINVTEAVVSIDVNSGRSTGQSDVEHTAFQTNKEAAEVIAKQLKLRDLGGLIVIDFIDMIDRKHKAIVEKTIKDFARGDKAKIEIGRISKFGLLELSRQRLKSALVNHSHVTCPQCEGRGRIRSAESSSLEALRKIQSSAFAGGVSEIRVHMNPVPAMLLLNDKRSTITDFERRSNTRIIIFPDNRKKAGEYDIELITQKGETTNTTIKAESPRHENSQDRNSRNRRRTNNNRGRSNNRNNNRNNDRNNDRRNNRNRNFSKRRHDSPETPNDKVESPQKTEEAAE